MKKKKAKPRVGRPPKPESERAVVVSTKVPPAVRDYLVRLGGGKLTAGLRAVAVAAYQQAGHDFEKK